MTLSSLGIFHTLISIVSIVTGAMCLLRGGRITWSMLAGKVYLVTMLVTCATGFGIYSKGVWSPGHTLTVISLITLAVAVFGEVSGRNIVRDITYSLSYFILWFFTVTEAFTRLPVGAPIAADQNAPVINIARLIALMLTIALIVTQVRRNRALAR
jgi:uncharacterized membrane protein